MDYSVITFMIIIVIILTSLQATLSKILISLNKIELILKDLRQKKDN